MSVQQLERALRTQLARNMRATKTLALTIPARIMLEAVYAFGSFSDCKPEEREWALRVQTLLSDSIMEAWREQPEAVKTPGMILQAQVKAYLLRDFIERPGRPGRPILLTCMAAVFMLNEVIERGEIVLAEGSAGHQAITEIIDSINANDEMRDNVSRSARKVSRRWLETLERLKIYAAT